MEESGSQCTQQDGAQSQSQSLLSEIADESVDDTKIKSGGHREPESIIGAANDNVKDQNERTTSEAKSLTSESPEDDFEKVSLPEFTFGIWPVYVCAVCNFGLSIGLPLAMSAMFLDWQEAFQVTRAHTVAVQSTAVGILFGGSIIPGYLMNRFGARVTVLIGSFLASFGCFISCFATSINFLIASVGVLGGLGFSFINLPSMPVITTVFTSKYRGIAVALCTCGSAICNMSFPYLYRYLVHHYTWRETFAFISGISLQTAIFGLVMTSHVKSSSRCKLLSVDDLDTAESHPMNNDQTADTQKSKPDGRAQSHDNDAETYYDDRNGDEINSLKTTDMQLCHDEKQDFKRAQVLLRLRALPQLIRASDWNFIFDFYYILLLVNLCTCMPSLVSFILFMMDFAKDKGFQDDSVGVFFLFIVFICSMGGRLVIGALDMVPYLHSIVLMGIYGIIASVALVVLGSVTGYSTIVGFLVLLGLGSGGAIAIYTKCVLDIDSVTMRTYPLALGLAGTMEGILDFLIPIFIGFVVDRTGSYTLVYHILGSISLTTSIILVAFKSVSIIKTYRANANAVKSAI